MNSLAELLGLPITVTDSAERKQEWKEIQQSLKSIFIKLGIIRDSHWLKRHKAFYFKGDLSEWDNKDNDMRLRVSGKGTYAYCLPLFMVWYHHYQGDDLINAVRKFVLQHDPELEQVKQGRKHIYLSTQGVYHNRDYGVFGPATPSLVKLFWEGELAKAYEERYETQRIYNGKEILLLYFKALISCFAPTPHVGRIWHPGRFMRERALAASQVLPCQNDDFLVPMLELFNEFWKVYHEGKLNRSEMPPEIAALTEPTDRQLREDIQSGALSGWVADILTKGVKL